MQRHPLASPAEGEWIPVSSKRPCSICGGQDGCRVGFDGQFAGCARSPSEWPLTTGGWVHPLAPAVRSAGVKALRAEPHRHDGVTAAGLE
jgi:hypothetical protein